MAEKNPVLIFKCLADNSRLRIISNLMETPMYVELLAERLDLTPSTISFHLKKLEEAGLVYSTKEQYYVLYNINAQVLESTLKDFIKPDSGEKQLQREREENYRQKVIEAFFEYGKLKAIPVQRKKRRIVLEEIVKSFDAGRVYTEKEVNIIIADFHDDFCTIRREMISENLMSREKGMYTVCKEIN